MKISMHIICEELTYLNPESSIIDGNLCVDNVKLLNSDSVNGSLQDYLNQNNNTLFVGSAELFGIKSNENVVVCKNNNDYFLIKNRSVPFVLNEIQDCFIKYNNIENQYRNVLYNKESLENLMKICILMINDNMILVDKNYFVLSDSEIDYNYDSLNAVQKFNIDYWHGVIKNTVVSSRLIPILTTRSRETDCATITLRLTKDTEPVIVRATKSEGVINCHIICCNIFTPDTKAKEQKLELFATWLNSWFKVRMDMPQHKDSYGLSNKMFSTGEITTTDILSLRWEQFKWKKDDIKCFIMVYNKQNPTIVARQICFMFNSIVGCYCGHDDTYAYLQINRSLLTDKAFSTQVLASIKKTACIAGISDGFTDIHDVFTEQKKALLALKNGPQNSGSISYYKDCIIPAIREYTESKYGDIIYHPALKKLEDFDNQSEMNLCETMYQFLLNGHNYAKTAQKLFVHRNTVEYRVNKALEIMGVSLDDESYSHLLVSFMLKYSSSN